MLKEIAEQLDDLYRAYSDGCDIGIWSHMYLDGTPINFRFYQEDSKVCRLVTGTAFSDWMAWCTGDWEKASRDIEALAKPYGATWDNEKGELSLRFRRNEMSVAEALIRLLQAVAVISALGPA